jgi:GT2 family glycosyltransferase
MNKISVVIPTIWRGNNLVEFLSRLENSNRVGEVIIIDNSPSEKNIDLSIYNKVRHIKMDENIYVNPAWNLGTELAKFDIVALGQDDILLQLDFLEDIIFEDSTIIGISESCYKDDCRYDPKLIDVNVRNWGFGTFILYKKDSYHIIPNELKIWYGDDFLFKKFNNRKVINNLPMYKKVSITSDMSEFDQIKRNDETFWKSLNII